MAFAVTVTAQQSLMFSVHLRSSYASARWIFYPLFLIAAGFCCARPRPHFCSPAADTSRYYFLHLMIYVKFNLGSSSNRGFKALYAGKELVHKQYWRNA
ncbi:hypothetical protein BDA96_05G151100 [Sorghum bicolor]|uniref:Uncharacterized protein n=2 Tax=Sorghum bicolor TaxID=4558 RepID=A0A1B6PSA8_SORBI|nr:hypothetical protein BDA96_05G151100 [Sorghum bicolor]KXG28557.1 hypothetical protein SORBI_3005G136900 [Sorghum bicolor]